MGDRTQLLNDAEEATRTALDGRQSGIWTCLPCKVVSVNFDQMTVQLQPTIQGVVLQEDGTTKPINLPVLADVPICFPSAGGFTLTLPIAVGDEMLAIFSSRCIDAWWQLGGVQPPLEARMHDLSDAFAIPGPKSLPNVITGISTTTAQLRSNDGDTYLEIDASGKVNIKAGSGIKITGDLEVTGKLHVRDTSQLDSELTVGTLPFTSHIHVGVTPGTGVSGGPIP